MTTSDMENAQEKYKPKIFSIIVFMVGMSCIEFAQKDLTGSQFQSLLAAKFNWQDQATSDARFTTITTLGLVGTLLGNAVTGKFMKYGRRNSVFCGAVIAIIGAVFMQILAYYVFISGTILVQFGTGAMEVAQSRLVEEYVPLELLGPCLAVISVVGQLSTLVGLLSVSWMPPDSDREALEEDESWRLVQGLQLICLLIFFFYLICFVKYDSPKYYITQKRDSMAKKVIRQIYETNDNNCTDDQILEEIKQLSSVETNDVGFQDAFWYDETYRRSSWVALILTATVWLCGFQVILNYANNMFTQIQDEDFPLEPRQSTYALGASQLIGSLLSLWAVSRFGRRTLLLVGHLGCAILLSLMAIAIIWDFDRTKLIAICLYAFLFNVTNATVINVYLVEICTDIAFGTALVVMQLVILLQTATALDMIAWLKPEGFFMFYAMTSFIGFLFVYFCVGETMGLSEQDKKFLYQPGGRYGRKPKPNEVRRMISKENMNIEMATDQEEISLQEQSKEPY